MPDRILASFRQASIALETEHAIRRATRDHIPDQPIDPASAAGKQALRGIPVVGGCSGTSPGTDPLQALLDKQPRSHLADHLDRKDTLR